MKKFTITCLLMGLMLIFASCGSTSTEVSTSSETSSETSTETSSEESTEESVEESAEADDVMAEVEALLKDVSGKPTFFQSEFGSVDVTAALSDKKVMLVAYDSTNDWCVNYVKMANEVYAAAGAVPFITYCDGSADSWIAAIQSAINQGYDAIDLFGISDIGQLENVISEAKAAGIYVQDTHGTDISDTSSPTDISIGADYNRAGKLMALQTISEIGSTEDVNCLVIADVGWGADTQVRDGITEIFDGYNVNYKIADVSITDWTEGIGNAVRNSFIADSTYNSIIAFYDNMCLYVVPAVEELGISLDDVVIGSFNGNPALVDYVNSGNMDYNLGESIGWTAFHAVDCMARSFAEQTVYNDRGFALYFITSDNVDQYIDSTGKASYSYDGVQDIYIPGYEALWGITLEGVFDNIE